MKMVGYLWAFTLSGIVFCLLMLIIASSGSAHVFRGPAKAIRTFLNQVKRSGKEYLRQVKVPELMKQTLWRDSFPRTGLRIEKQLFLAGWWVSLKLLGVSLMSLWIWMSGRNSLLVILLLTGMLVSIAPAGYLRYLSRQRQKALRRTFPDFLDLLNMTVRAGIGFLPALRRVSESMDGPLGEDLQTVNNQIEMGFTVSQALSRWAEISQMEDVERFVESVNLSQRLGTSLSRTLRIQAELLRAKRRRKAEEQVQTAPIRIIPALVFCFLPSLMLIYLAPPILNFLLRR